MARSVSVIENQIIAEKNAQAALSGLNSTSQTAIYRTWIFIQAVTINLFEQVLDAYKTVIEIQLSKSAPATPLWIQQKVFEFQYDPSSNPLTNIVQILSDFSVGYPTVDEQFRIISQCSVTTDANKNILVKVATGSPPGPVGSTPLSQLNGYLETILPAGLKAFATSGDADKCYVEAEVFFQGIYSNSIKASVEAAINNYFTNIPFNGIVRVSDIEKTVLNVPGVIDINIAVIKARADATVFGSATVIYDLSNSINGRLWNTVTGYILAETTSGKTLADTITYTPQSN